jgi:hydroxypyruvate isomerase
MSEQPISRRDILTATAAAIAAGTLASDLLAEDHVKTPAESKKLKHSIVQWCFKDHWNIEEQCGVATKLGCKSVETVPVQDWPTLKKHGLICALAVAHGFDKGMNNPKYHEMCLEKLHKAIDDCALAGFPNVITFTGFREDIPDDVGLKNCVAGFKKIVGHAEKKKINLVLEMLNSRVDAHMKGHPGYQGDHTDYCMEIIKQVASPRFKLLFDIYHVQIMDGDIITRIRQYAEWIGHVHTAGNPGRCELDHKQEIHYPPIMKALADVGYTGYVGHEFIPTRDPMGGLKEAIAVCDY